MLKYIELNDDKTPKSNFDTTYTSMDKLRSAGLKLNNNIVVVDFDGDNYEENKIIDYFTTHYPTLTIKTTKGVHLYYKRPTGIAFKSKADVITAGGFQVDYKTGSKSYGIVKIKGFERERNRDLTISDLPEIPILLYPLPLKNNLTGLSDGDSRNSNINAHLFCIKAKYKDLDIKNIAEFINSNFKDPLKNKELESTVESVLASDPLSNLNEYKGDDKDMIVFGEWVIKKFDIKMYQTKLYFKDGLRYISDNRLLLNRISKFKKLKRVQDNELIHQITKFVEDVSNSESEYPILLNNGIILDGEYMALSEPIFTPFYLNINYDPDINYEPVDRFLDEISCGIPEIRQTLEEILGHILLTSKFPAHVFFLLGNGQNGKSTFLEMVNNFVGELGQNLNLDAFNDGTSVASLTGKLSNCSDETDDIYIDKCRGYKSLASGNTITVRPIYSPPVKVKNTATLILSANKMPEFKDKTGGFFRRLKIIPFNFTIERKIADLDRLLSTPKAKSYILNICLRGIKKIKANGYKISDNPYIDTKVEEYILETDSVASYLQEYPEIHGNPTNLVYTQYTVYCEETGAMALKLSNFSKRLKDFGYIVQPRRVNNTTRRCYLKEDFIGKNYASTTPETTPSEIDPGG